MFDLKQFRKDFGITQKAMAEIFNCVQPNISAFERLGKDLEDYQSKILVEKFGEDIVKKYIIPNTTTNIGQNFGAIGGNNRSTYTNVGNTINLSLPEEGTVKIIKPDGTFEIYRLDPNSNFGDILSQLKELEFLRKSLLDKEALIKQLEKNIMFLESHSIKD